MDLSRVTYREGLKAQREPHWQRLRPGCFLGYRPSVRKGGGTWIARAYDEDARKYRLRSLGHIASLPARDRFLLAKKEAEAFADSIEAGASPRADMVTVEDACRAYGKANEEALARFTRHVFDDPVSKVKLQRLRRRHLLEWRDRLQAKPSLVSRSKVGPARTRPRAPASLNRDMAALRAALNKVLAPGAPNTEACWQEALKPIKNADRQRTLYLDRQQRRALLASVEPEANAFVLAMCLLPLRPGALAALTVADFDSSTKELTVSKDKAGNRRRVVLPPEAAALFASEAKGKLPGASLFMRLNGHPWSKESWKGPIRRAACHAGLSPQVTAYTLRHSTITDLIAAGLPLLTVAQISGTSAEMIERHYGHLARELATGALAGLAL